MLPHKRRSANVSRGTKVDGRWQLRDYQLTPEQGVLMSLYDLVTDNPKIGPSQARGLLQIGELESSTQEEPKRKNVRAIFTKYNLAEHFGFYKTLYNLLDEAEKFGLVIPDELHLGYDMYARDTFDTRIAFPLRQHLEKRGVEGKIPCWLYVCPISTAYADPNSGMIEFKYQENWPLTVIPQDPNLAVKRWNISNDRLAEMSLAAGWLVFTRFPSLRIITNENKLVKLFGDWRDCLPQPRDAILKYLRETASRQQE